MREGKNCPFFIYVSRASINAVFLGLCNPCSGMTPLHCLIPERNCEFHTFLVSEVCEAKSRPLLLINMYFNRFLKVRLFDFC